MSELVLFVVLATPIVALIDYFAFRKQFKKEMGEPMKWYYFVVPCALELGCFTVGYIIGQG